MFGFLGRLFGRGVRNQGPLFLEFLKTLIDRHGRGVLEKIADALEQQNKIPTSAATVDYKLHRANENELHDLLAAENGVVSIEGRQYVAGFWGLILPVIMELFTRFLERLRK